MLRRASSEHFGDELAAVLQLVVGCGAARQHDRVVDKLIVRAEALKVIHD